MGSGQLGDVRLVISLWMNHATTLSNRQFEGKIDWARFLGSAPKREPSAQRFFDWYYFWDYSGGLLVGQAAHMVDAIQRFMNSKAPLAVTCAGGKPNIPGAQITGTATLCIEYAENYFANFTLGHKTMRYHGSNDKVKQFHDSKARLKWDAARRAVVA
jgi:predicted dehydrogenase